ncbi:MAG: metal-dependent hydrolase [Gammaproteobacteria bacterium]|nr:metal-dependent hydrolase [Gammaproteobacteria bacterium]
MPNATAHRLVAGLAVGSASAYIENQNGENTYKPLVHGVLAAAFGTLPDILEPACHPNHRQFFHSFGFAGMLGYGMYRLSKWETNDEFEKAAKKIGQIAIGACCIHLLMDSTTPKLLPII